MQKKKKRKINNQPKKNFPGAELLNSFRNQQQQNQKVDQKNYRSANIFMPRRPK